MALAARVNLDRNLCSDDDTRRRAGRDYLRYCVEVAHALGAGVVGGPLYGNPLVFAARAPHPVDEALRQRREAWCVEGLREAAPIAAAAGVRLGVEPLNRFETDVLNTTRQGVALMGLVDHDAVGLVLDTFHMNMEDDDIADAIRAAGRHLIHFQANENHRGHLGSGHIDWTAVVRALGDVDYRGWITLEPFRRNDERIGIPFAQWKPPAHDEQGRAGGRMLVPAQPAALERSPHMTTRRMVWIGCGRHAEQMLLPQLLRHDVELVGVCDLNAEVAARVGKRYGVAHVATDHRELLALARRRRRRHGRRARSRTATCRSRPCSAAASVHGKALRRQRLPMPRRSPTQPPRQGARLASAS